MRLFLLFSLLLLAGCADFFGSGQGNDSDYTEIAWEDLKPPREDILREESLLNDLEGEDDGYNLEIEDHRAVDDYYASTPGLSGMQMNVPPVSFSQFSVVEKYDGQAVRVPGFIVPIEYEGESVTEFFLVPYFGACLHNPPPPPNQIIYVMSDQGVEVNSIYEPFWVQGVLETKQTGNEIATAAYTMAGHDISTYEY